MARELTGRGTLAILLVSFGIVFAVNGYMAAQAISTFRGDDEDHAYLQGLGYNQTLDRRAAQKALGWQATLAASRSASGHLQIVFDVKDRAGRPVPHLQLSGFLRHPADANRDRRLLLVETQPGAYTATLENVSAGTWKLLVQTGARGAPFEAERSLWLR